MTARLRIIGTALLVVGILTAGPALAKSVEFRGTSVNVPAGWPVFDLRAHPQTCVRFDRPAVYLGRPGTDQRCPAVSLGRPRALLLEPQGHGAIVLSRAGETIPPAGRTAARLARAPARAAGATYTGAGFDACTAPSTGTMNRWLASPYRAIGVYIGGTNMGCSQPNLTATWVSQQTAAGWRFMPIYVGLQAPRNSCNCAGINPGQATGQGRAAASDAASRARALGLGPGNPIYLDMEAYDRSSTNTSAVLAFEAGWTNQLHAAGYQSGIYSSAASGITDLVDHYGTSYPEPDDLWFAEWNGSPSTTSSYIPSGAWAGHHRLHQYSGDHNEKFGGVTLDIDSDSLDGLTAGAGGAPAPLIPDGTFIQLTSTGQIFRMAGGAPLYVNDPSSVGNPTSFTSVGVAKYNLLNPVPLDGTFLQTQSGFLYRVAGGFPFPIAQPSLYPGINPVQIDSWDVDNADNPLSHLSLSPADGTVVRGRPSGQAWIFSQGRRTRVPARSAVAVDDSALNQFPLAPCLVPRLGHLSLTQVRGLLSLTNCRLGRVARRHRPRPGHVLHVVRQFPGPNAQRKPLTPVSVTLA
jgi:hypothetical protein